MREAEKTRYFLIVFNYVFEGITGHANFTQTCTDGKYPSKDNITNYVKEDFAESICKREYEYRGHCVLNIIELTEDDYYDYER